MVYCWRRHIHILWLVFASCLKCDQPVWPSYPRHCPIYTTQALISKIVQSHNLPFISPLSTMTKYSVPIHYTWCLVADLAVVMLDLSTSNGHQSGYSVDTILVRSAFLYSKTLSNHWQKECKQIYALMNVII